MHDHAWSQQTFQCEEGELHKVIFVNPFAPSLPRTMDLFFSKFYMITFLDSFPVIFFSVFQKKVTIYGIFANLHSFQDVAL